MKMIFPKFEKPRAEARYKEKTWRKAFDSKTGTYITLKRRFLRDGDRCASWKVLETGEILYSPIGGTPLFITFTDGM